MADDQFSWDDAGDLYACRLGPLNVTVSAITPGQAANRAMRMLGRAERFRVVVQFDDDGGVHTYALAGSVPLLVRRLSYVGPWAAVT